MRGSFSTALPNDRHPPVAPAWYGGATRRSAPQIAMGSFVRSPTLRTTGRADNALTQSVPSGDNDHLDRVSYALTHDVEGLSDRLQRELVGHQFSAAHPPLRSQ